VYQITLTLDQDLQESLDRYSQIAGEPVEAYLGRALRLIGQAFDNRQIESLSDAEVLDQTQLFLLPEQDERLSVLLDGQRESRLNPEEKQELVQYLHLYTVGLWRKAQAIAEAKERGLISSLAEA
jgi:hypothetical protein